MHVRFKILLKKLFLKKKKENIEKIKNIKEVFRVPRPDDPYDGCKFSTAARFAHFWNLRVGRTDSRYKVRQVDITSSPMHQRVTAFTRLMDERVHAESKTIWPI